LAYYKKASSLGVKSEKVVRIVLIHISLQPGDRILNLDYFI